MDTKTALRKYAKEIGIESISLEHLIESHRHLRSLNLEKSNEWRKELDAARERGLEEGRKHAMENEFISVERLRSMALVELCALIDLPD